MALNMGETIPGFSVPATDGRSYSEKDIAGSQATVVMFWCNHCPFVIPNQQRIIDMQREFGPQGVKFAAVCSNNADSHPADSFENMVKRAQEMGYNFPYLHDEMQEAARAFGAQRTPEVFLFDGAGKLCYRGRIDDCPEDVMRAKSHDLRNAIGAVLAGKQPDPAETGAVGCTIKWRQATGAI
jgi:peroxiredoxin